VTVTNAGFEVLPSLSCTVYWIGVGSPAKPTSGVKVIAPVPASTVHWPWPGTVSVLPSGESVLPAGGLTIWTVVGTTVSPVVSLASTGTVTGLPAVFPPEASSRATGT